MNILFLRQKTDTSQKYDVTEVFPALGLREAVKLKQYQRPLTGLLMLCFAVLFRPIALELTNM